MPTFEVEEDKPFFLSPGIHKMEVVEAVERTSKSGNEMIVIQLEAENGFRVRDYLVFTKKTAFKIKQFLEAAGRELKKGDSVTLTDSECLQFDPLFVELAPDEEKPQFMAVKRYLPKKEGKELLKYQIKAAKELEAKLEAERAKMEADEIPF